MDIPPSLRRHIFTFFMDLRNCYGNVNRSIFVEILNANPDLATIVPYFTLVYGSQSSVFFSFSKTRNLLCALDVAKNGLFLGEAFAAFIACVVLNHVTCLALLDFTIEERLVFA